MPRTGLSASELRERAVDATLVRIRSVGFAKVRLIDVARDVGVSHAALYAHFSDKAELLDAAAERWLQETHELVAPVADGEADPQKAITTWLVTLYQVKRTRAVRDPWLFEAFDIASTRRKHYVGSHVTILIRHLAMLFKKAEEVLGDGEEYKRATIAYQATVAFHHPTLIAQRAHEDREAELRDIVRILLKGMTE